jgi:PRTRC genetic system protein B
MIAKSSTRVIGPMDDPDIPYQAALYFLEGDYLYRCRTGSALTSKFVTAKDLAAAFAHVEQDSGWLDAGVVRSGYGPRGTWYVYWAPPQQVEIRIGEEEPIHVPIPLTVMMGRGTDYYLWALRGQKFAPGETVFQAPFPNVYPDGRICWGQNKPGQADPRRAPKLWSTFFTTPFNHDLANGKSRGEIKDVTNRLKKLADRNKGSYPTRDLISTERTVDSLIHSKLEAR